MHQQIPLRSIWAVVFLVCSWLWPLSSADARSLREVKYDMHFRQQAELHMPGVDWRLLKAQCFAESNFRERAVSPVGAQGICQFMPATWRDVQRRFPTANDPFDYRQNIQAAAWYMAQLRRAWNTPRPEQDRHSLAMASYNAGLGNIARSQRLCNNAVLFEEIMRCLPQVTGRHHEETDKYVARIWSYWRQLVIFD